MISRKIDTNAGNNQMAKIPEPTQRVIKESIQKETVTQAANEKLFDKMEIQHLSLKGRDIKTKKASKHDRMMGSWISKVNAPQSPTSQKAAVKVAKPQKGR